MPGIRPPSAAMSWPACPPASRHPRHGVAAGRRHAPQRQPALHPAGLVGLRRRDVEGELRGPRGPRCGRRPGWPSRRPAGGGAPCPGRSRRRPSRRAGASVAADAERDGEPAAEQHQPDGDHGRAATRSGRPRRPGRSASSTSARVPCGQLGAWSSRPGRARLGSASAWRVAGTDRGAGVALDQRVGDEGRVLAAGAGLRVNSPLQVRKSANCSIRLSSAESTFSWWFHDWRLIGESRPA